jgi:hypothetical protein
MASERKSRDFDRANDDIRSPAEFDGKPQVKPEPAEGPTRGAKIVIAAAVALIVGAVFYGLNNSSVHQAGTSSTAQNTSPPPAPSGMRDVTPRANTQPGMTTGAASARPQMPSPPAPADTNRAGNPPTDHTAPTNNAAPGN